MGVKGLQTLTAERHSLNKKSLVKVEVKVEVKAKAKVAATFVVVALTLTCIWFYPSGPVKFGVS